MQNKPKAIVLDVDGVILNSDFILQEIHELGLKGDEMWGYFHKYCNSDRVQLMPRIKEFIHFIRYANDDVYIIISTARVNKFPYNRKIKSKLAYNGIFFDKMYMRTKDDLRPAYEVKKEHLIEIMKDYDIIAFIDDDLTNCQMAKDLGILSLRRI